MRKYIFLLLTFLSIESRRGIAQQPGDLDNSFGIGGKVVMPQVAWMDVAVQPDGKIVAVSHVIARYKTDGTLDSTFATNGIDTIKSGSGIVHCSAVGIQPDGKILVVGGPVYGNVNLKDFLVLRYNANGSLDSSFDGDGELVTDFDLGSDDFGYELAIQTEGKIIVAGASNQKLALCRLHPDGSLDSTFDQDGKVVINNITVDFNNNWSHATFMKLQADGKIVAGSASLIARINPDGNMDNSFGTNGLKGLSAPMNDLAIQADGKIALAGGATTFVIMRLDSNGNYDSGFGLAGMTSTAWTPGNCSNPRQKATSILLQPDGRLLAGGYNMCCLLGDCREFVLIRYNSNGSIDSSFSSDGRVTTNFSGLSTESRASALTPDRKIVLGGYSYNVDYGAMARYHLGTMLDVKSAQKLNSHLIVTPNPSHDMVSIKANGIENGIWRMELLDETGRSVLHETITVNNNSFHKQISLQLFGVGVYFLKLSGATQSMSFKIVKGI
ncbi:MAG TPA: T9SS type A sorting domain-containing protein [Flavipsychrobacter sp.]|nr:T9SS type A sorting domain-containing protein [Flavipsychrobacter sp.]